MSAAFLMLAGCGEQEPPKPTLAETESVAAVAKASTIVSTDTASRTLASSLSAAAYRIDETPGAEGIISGDVRMVGALPVDSMVTPNRDSTGCRPFEDVTFPRARGSRTKGARVAVNDTAEHNVGNAVVWLVGVTHGPRDNSARRISLVLNDCHLDPRVLVAPMGATINISNRDDMIVKLRFVDHNTSLPARATIGFTDPGQVVPTALPLAKAGLVEVTDELHGWVRGYIAVAPHPFVAVTEADGEFEFAGVPAGEYQLVVWHERIGAKVMKVKVEGGATLSVSVRY